MKLVVQRVQSARVLVEGQVVGEIGRGALILLGVARNDTPFDLRYLARKASQLRIFDDENGQLNSSIESARGAFLVVSQFTLYGECAKGNRPSYIEAAPPDRQTASTRNSCANSRPLAIRFKPAASAKKCWWNFRTTVPSP